ncbi:hypothetical protein BABINDRAFT_167292 [Babjeviella inositovora NRRL Y-12698]|uniref:FAD-binding FR-type domain-containing protein n=1 Tax=Babjeviella inositovora NRRL Y-12698 TaxID=984486 RepID=A0A1E3QP15_9ASCO|nr:uncharacterized protein BABINDRAFT_167292 [Babjeviella inositovora NRRL Y-12698]ODQ79433.1 hypothetical protein BABINDRAFT_167292 [Babjeviella inositovora NRRL Y-12698]
MVDLIPRHGDHHTANLKYGYLTLLLSLLHTAAIPLSSYLYRKRWLVTGKANNSLRFYSNIPLTVKVGAWIVVVVALCTYKVSAETFTTNVKRAGRIAYVLIPFDILLALKPSPLANYLELVALHKWVSRVIVGLSLAHGVGFLGVWIARGDGQILKVFEFLNLLGVLNFLLFGTLLVISVRYFRDRLYPWFFVVHQVTVWSTVVLITFHARPGVLWYSLICTALLLLQVYLKIYYTKDILFQEDNFVSAEGSLLVVVALPRSKLSYSAEIQPASHLRINRHTKYNYKTWILPSHPYTVATYDDTAASLIVKKTHFQLQPNVTYSLFGPPFKSSMAFEQETIASLSHVIIVCGGSGISYGLPILSRLQKIRQDASHTQSNENLMRQLKLVWCVRNKADIFVLDHLKVSGRVEVYVTSGVDTSKDGGNDIEMESLDESTSNPFADPKRGYTVSYGRPNLPTLVGDFNQTLTDSSNRWIIACGPQGLVDDCRGVSKKFGINFNQEVYRM